MIGGIGGVNNATMLKDLVTEPVRELKHLIGSTGHLEKHNRHDYHKNSLLAADDFIHTYNTPEIDVINWINKK